MRQISAKQSAKNSILAKIKAELPEKCVIPNCVEKGTDLAHLLPKSLYPEYYTYRKNLVRMCRRHHELFDDDRMFRRRQTALHEQAKSFDELSANRHFL